MQNLSSEYRYDSAQPTWSNQYLWPPLREIVASHLKPGDKIIDVGCGGGATAAMLAELGFVVTAYYHRSGTCPKSPL